MKKIIFLLITIVLIFTIYNHFSFKKVKYVSITDNILNDYNNYLSNNKLRDFNNSFVSPSILDLYHAIKDNKTIKVGNDIYYLKKVLRESDVLVISVGMEELTKNYNKYDMAHNNNYLNKMYDDITKLIKEIKKYAYEKIIFIGYYNPTNYYDSSVDNFFYNWDIKLNELMVNNDINYINTYELVKGNTNINKKLAGIIEFYFE